jgi:hypothetical protein
VEPLNVTTAPVAYVVHGAHAVAALHCSTESATDDGGPDDTQAEAKALRSMTMRARFNMMFLSSAGLTLR